jgi:hypothetical protein
MWNCSWPKLGTLHEGTEETHEKPESTQLVSEPEYEEGTLLTRRRPSVAGHPVPLIRGTCRKLRWARRVACRITRSTYRILKEWQKEIKGKVFPVLNRSSHTP